MPSNIRKGRAIPLKRNAINVVHFDLYCRAGGGRWRWGFFNLQLHLFRVGNRTVMVNALETFFLWLLIFRSAGLLTGRNIMFIFYLPSSRSLWYGSSEC